MKYPLARFYPTDTGRRMLLDCYDSGMISSVSPYVEKFERFIAHHAGVKHAVTCSSGTAALHLACAVLGFKPGEAVIVPELTYIATANAVAYTGVEVVPVDVDPETWNIDIEKWGAPLAEPSPLALDSSVKAVICTHLLGNPCDMAALVKFCAKHDLMLIEDACEAWETQWHGRMAGSIGDIGVFSFYGNKHITTGEGGALVTNHEHVADAARHLRSQAGGSDYVHDRRGFNYRMTGLQAAVGFSFSTEPWMLERQYVLQVYRRHMPKSCKFQGFRGVDANVHGAWVAGVELPCSSAPVQQSLAEEGIETRPMFRPMSEAPMYGPPLREQHPNAYRLADRAIMLPCLPEMSEHDVRFICSALARAVQ